MTISAIEADARLQTRLENQRELIHIPDAGGTKGASTWSSVREGCVELMNWVLMEKLLSCPEICSRIASMGSLGPGWRSWYVWTLNAVRTADSKPAWYEATLAIYRAGYNFI